MPVILILPSIWGLNGVIYAQAVADILTTLVTVLFAVHIHKELRKEINKKADLNGDYSLTDATKRN